jgi:hypothetical protein
MKGRGYAKVNTVEIDTRRLYELYKDPKLTELQDALVSYIFYEVCGGDAEKAIALIVRMYDDVCKRMRME